MAGDGHTSCLVATVKDEGPWLLEWVAHHMATEFDRIVVACNDCSDGTDLMLARLEQLGILRMDFNAPLRAKGNIQVVAYNRLRRFPEVANARWVITLDADEFLNVKRGNGTVAELVAGFDPDVEAVPIVCRYFGDAGHTGWVGTPMCETFQRADIARPKYNFIKLLLRNHQDHMTFGVHSPRPYPLPHPPTVLADLSGTRLPTSLLYDTAQPLRFIPERHCCFDIAQINHYAVKTRDMFGLKRLRGDAAGAYADAKRLKPGDYDRYNRNDVADTSIMRTATLRQQHLDALLADPVLGPLHDRAVEAARNRLATLVEQTTPPDGAPHD